MVRCVCGHYEEDHFKDGCAMCNCRRFRNLHRKVDQKAKRAEPLGYVDGSLGRQVIL